MSTIPQISTNQTITSRLKISEYKKRPQHLYDLGNPGSGLRQANSVEGLNQSMRFQSSHINTDINKTQKTHILSQKMNNNKLFPQIHNHHNQNPETTIIIPCMFYGKTEIDKEIIFFLVYNSFWNQIIGSNEKWTS